MAALHEGMTVTITGLSSPTDLNGKLGILLSFFNGRWGTRLLDSSENVLVKPVNLVPYDVEKVVCDAAPPGLSTVKGKLGLWFDDAVSPSADTVARFKAALIQDSPSFGLSPQQIAHEQTLFESPTKQRRKDKSKQSDLVVLHVGGKKFTTNRTTLRAGSTYFSTLFSESSAREDDENDENGAYVCFLDKNPKAFGVLLECMREGMVQVNDLANVKVLALADYLGMEELILAIKVATFVNLHPTFPGTEDEAQQAFDNAYGSFKSAITSGLLPKALQGQPEGRGTEYAVMNMGPIEAHYLRPVTITAPELNNVQEQGSFTILGALNWMHYHGYTILENMSTTDRCGDEKIFSRPSNVFIEFPCTHVLIGWNRRNPPIRKTFALFLSTFDNDRSYFAPRGGREVPLVGYESRWCTLGETNCSLKFLQAHNYVCREEELEAESKNDVHECAERIFNPNINRIHQVKVDPNNVYFQIYSRVLDEEEGATLS